MTEAPPKPKARPATTPARAAGAAATRRPPRRKPASPGSGPFGRGDLPTSLLLIFPLFLAYEVGVMFSPTVNGVDFVSRWVFAAVGYDRDRYLIVHLVLAVVFLGLLLWLRRRRSFSLRVWPPMLIEAAIYALTLGSAIVFVRSRVFGMSLGPEGQAFFMSLGAGVHEELVFRLGLMGGGAAALMLVGLDRFWAVTLALVASSLLFSAAHHAGPLGDPFDMSVFIYRALAGVAFGLIFYFRSLAHAAYAHFLYDVYVMVFHHG
jgi:hypothetical protein